MSVTREELEAKLSAMPQQPSGEPGSKLILELINWVFEGVGVGFHYHVKNSTDADILRGTALMATGTVGASGNITVAPLVSDGSIPPMFYLGVTNEDIVKNAESHLFPNAVFEHFDTNSWNEGDVLWADPATPGGLTNTEPDAPNLRLPIGFVIRKNANTGIMVTRYTGGHRLADSHDVKLTNLQDDDYLRWDATAGYWYNSAT